MKTTSPFHTSSLYLGFSLLIPSFSDHLWYTQRKGIACTILLLLYYYLTLWFLLMLLLHPLDFKTWMHNWGLINNLKQSNPSINVLHWTCIAQRSIHNYVLHKDSSLPICFPNYKFLFYFFSAPFSHSSHQYITREGKWKNDRMFEISTQKEGDRLLRKSVWRRVDEKVGISLGRGM